MPNLPEDPEALPLRRAWLFLESNGLAEQAQAIRISTDRLGSYTSTLKRAKIVGLLEQLGLLNQFVREHWPNGSTDQGKRLLDRYRGILKRFLNGDDDEQEAEEDPDETQFAIESHLRDYLAKNLQLIEKGLTLWPVPSDARAVEFPVDTSGRRIDILGKDVDGIPVVIELKVSRGHERTIGQALYYRSKIKEMFDRPSVRMVIVARAISPELRLAAREIQDCELFEYGLSMRLSRVT